MVLVCVTDQETCSRLIYAGRKLADIKDIPLKVICVRPRKAAGWLASEEVEYLFGISKQQNAEMVVLFNDDPAAATVDYVSRNKVNFIMTGIPPQSGQSVFISELEDNFPQIPLITVDHDGTLQKLPSQHTA
ncbi:MAG: hypothetical protein PWP10_3376 [Clostridiales bacterium]|jgi:K+-sensing histidine kinase KdpD|nr:hypothetical protein [Eubacteriales bacterium]MDD3197585.1 hypothetical protein [Eubacteriales bacterium]MDD3503090.1 hypothetical protein [Eubacteriales bacterium]MDD4683157.1 hypothetical protein [Eubacteriales bacterium]MDN5314626.1 hypothetical protein [Clostridiales bacterium]